MRHHILGLYLWCTVCDAGCLCSHGSNIEQSIQLRLGYHSNTTHTFFRIHPFFEGGGKFPKKWTTNPEQQKGGEPQKPWGSHGEKKVVLSNPGPVFWCKKKFNSCASYCKPLMHNLKVRKTFHALEDVATRLWMKISVLPLETDSRNFGMVQFKQVSRLAKRII